MVAGQRLGSLADSVSTGGQPLHMDEQGGRPSMDMYFQRLETWFRADSLASALQPAWLSMGSKALKCKCFVISVVALRPRPPLSAYRRRTKACVRSPPPACQCLLLSTLLEQVRFFPECSLLPSTSQAAMHQNLARHSAPHALASAQQTTPAQVPNSSLSLPPVWFTHSAPSKCCRSGQAKIVACR